MKIHFVNRLLRYRGLIKTLLIRDIRSKYMGSGSGVFWTIINPLLLVVLYTYVFSVVLKVRWGADGSTAGYVFYLLSGMLPWIAIQESLIRSVTCIVDNAHLLKSFSFPSKIFPFYLSLSALINQIIGTLILMAAMSFLGIKQGWTLSLLPVLVLLQFIFMVGLAWIAATIQVFFRDTAQILGIFLIIWMFLTPIFYSESAVPAGFQSLLSVNPLTYLTGAYRDILLDGKMPAVSDFLVFGAIAIGVCIIGYLFFESRQPNFVDYV